MQKMRPLKVLVACEYSGVVRDAFLKAGHDAMSCDMLPTDAPGPHYQGNVWDILDENGGGYHLVIAHPPCTFLCNSGVRWLYNKDGSRNEERWQNMVEAAHFFKRFLNLKCAVAVENPIMHRYALEIIGRKATQFVQPWMFGHGETKATGLWLNGLRSLTPTKVVSGREQRVWKLPPGPERWKERSKTYQGIADAMAYQWDLLPF